METATSKADTEQWSNGQLVKVKARLLLDGDGDDTETNDGVVTGGGTNRFAKAAKIVKLHYPTAHNQDDNDNNTNNNNVSAMDIKYMSTGEIALNVQVSQVTPYINKVIERMQLAKERERHERECESASSNGQQQGSTSPSWAKKNVGVVAGLCAPPVVAAAAATTTLPIAAATAIVPVPVAATKQESVVVVTPAKKAVVVTTTTTTTSRSSTIVPVSPSWWAVPKQSAEKQPPASPVVVTTATKVPVERRWSPPKAATASVESTVVATPVPAVATKVARRWTPTKAAATAESAVPTLPVPVVANKSARRWSPTKTATAAVESTVVVATPASLVVGTKTEQRRWTPTKAVVAAAAPIVDPTSTLATGTAAAATVESIVTLAPPPPPPPPPVVAAPLPTPVAPIATDSKAVMVAPKTVLEPELETKAQDISPKPTPQDNDSSKTAKTQRLTRQALKFVERRQARRNLSPRSSKRRLMRLTKAESTKPAPKEDAAPDSSPVAPTRPRRIAATPECLRNYEEDRLSPFESTERLDFVRQYEANQQLRVVVVVDDDDVDNRGESPNAVQEIDITERLIKDIPANPEFLNEKAINAVVAGETAANQSADNFLLTPRQSPDQKLTSEWSNGTSPSPITKPRRLEYLEPELPVPEAPATPPRLVDGSIHYTDESDEVEILARVVVTSSSPLTPPRPTDDSSSLDTSSVMSTPRKNNTSLREEENTPDTLPLRHSRSDADLSLSREQNESLETDGGDYTDTDGGEYTESDGGEYSDTDGGDDTDTEEKPVVKREKPVVETVLDSAKKPIEKLQKSVQFEKGYSVEESMSDGGGDFSLSYYTEDSLTEDDRSIQSEKVTTRRRSQSWGSSSGGRSHRRHHGRSRSQSNHFGFCASDANILPDFKLVSKILVSAGGALFSSAKGKPTNSKSKRTRSRSRSIPKRPGYKTCAV